MSIVTFELDDLARLGVAKDIIKDTVERLGMSLENIDKSTATIDITPNRPDMLDIIGFARAAAFLGGKKTPKEKFYSIKNKTPALQIEVTDTVKKIRPFIAAAVVKNVDLTGNRLKDLINFTEKFCDTYGRKRKKVAIGIYNLETITGPLTYDASSDGEFIPLGSKTKMKFGTILKGHQKGTEYAWTLRETNRYPFIKDSKGTILSLIPIVNSEPTKVTPVTKNILIELTGTSQNAVEEGLNLIVCSFLDTNAEVYPCEIIYPNKKRITPQLEYKIIKLRRVKAENTLGFYLEDNKVISLANKLGHVAAKYGQYTLLYVPPYRIDVLNEQDIIEDIAIAYGYDKISPMPILGSAAAVPEESNEASNRAAGLMLGLGLTEAVNPYLTNEILNFKNLDRKYNENSIINVAYAKTEAITMLRTDLLPWLMQNLAGSVHEKMPQRLFEIGKVFHLEKGIPIESTNLAVVAEHAKVNYSEIKSIVIGFLKFAGANDYSLKEFSDPAFIEGRAAKIIIKGETVGYFGEISPKVLQNFRLEEPVVAAEIKTDKLI